MPVLRLPVVHKFGIISHSHRIELQKRLLLQKHASPKVSDNRRSDLDINDNFIKEYNEATSPLVREQLQIKAEKILERVKRKLGLKDGGIGSHVDLPSAWTDLSLLAQCHGHLQEESLALTIVSLSQAPIDVTHIATLFYLAESALYWLRMETASQPFFCTGELLMLVTGRLVFERLYFHHMAAQLSSFDDLRSHLVTYLDGFQDVQELYEPYPDALMCIHYICDVGRIIVGDFSSTEPKTDITVTGDECATARSSVVSSTVHELAPCLWHALDVWRCTVQLGGGLQSALDSLSDCGSQIASCNWVDAVCAIDAIADAAKVSLQVLTALQDIVLGIQSKMTDVDLPFSSADNSFMRDTENGTYEMSSDVAAKLSTSNDAKSTSDSRSHSAPGYKCGGHGHWREVSPSVNFLSNTLQQKASKHGQQLGIHGWPWEVAVRYVDALSDICLHGSTSVIQKQALIGCHQDATFLHKTSDNVLRLLPSAGLVDLAFFKITPEPDDGGKNDWSWRVRYAVVLNLVRIYRGFADDSLKDGFKSIAWNSLTKMNSAEKDKRVLEAFKIVQMNVSCEPDSLSNLHIHRSTLGAEISCGLSKIYLPPLAPPVTSKPSLPRLTVKKFQENVTKQLPATTAKRNKSLGVKARCCNQRTQSFEERTSQNLRAIVADQWKKELELLDVKENTAHDDDDE